MVKRESRDDDDGDDGDDGDAGGGANDDGAGEARQPAEEEADAGPARLLSLIHI